MTKIELLSPAKDASTAIAAITCGADAVYIGPEKFGARQAAGNTLDDIRKTIEYAHQYYAKVYATMNTILLDDEIAHAQRLIAQLYDTGIDGIIIQDAGLLEIDLPPVPIIASTQMNIDTAAKAEFFASLGLTRIILPRELSLAEIADIRSRCDIELEAFVHGAICVGQSGKCYMSYAMGSRSGNRGDCAQPCRKTYRLEDKNGKEICSDAYLLSIRDMNRSQCLSEMIDAGITSFKIEGRLKSIPYAANITAYYRRAIDEVIAAKNNTTEEKKKYVKASSGTVRLDFEPDPHRSFNRGFTTYNIFGRQEKNGTPETPKSIGQPVGIITRVSKNFAEIDGNVDLNNGDGICFFSRDGGLAGTVINRVEGKKIFPQDTTGLYSGCKVYRNNDHQFNKLLNRVPAQRKISIEMELAETDCGISLTAVDEDGVTATAQIPCGKEPARNVEAAQQALHKNLGKLGNTVFECSRLTISLSNVYFLTVAQINALRRELIENLLQRRNEQRPARQAAIVRNDLPYPEKKLDYAGNAANRKAERFYRRHGVGDIQPAAEAGTDLTGRVVMRTRYCIRKQLDICRRNNADDLYLCDENGNRFRVVFDCSRCGMNIIKE